LNFTMSTLAPSVGTASGTTRQAGIPLIEVALLGGLERPDRRGGRRIRAATASTCRGKSATSAMAPTPKASARLRASGEVTSARKSAMARRGNPVMIPSAAAPETRKIPMTAK
jgi:hypothetical protein